MHLSNKKLENWRKPEGKKLDLNEIRVHDPAIPMQRAPYQPGYQADCYLGASPVYAFAILFMKDRRNCE